MSIVCIGISYKMLLQTYNDIRWTDAIHIVTIILDETTSSMCSSKTAAMKQLQACVPARLPRLSAMPALIRTQMRTDLTQHAF